ncbi:MAG TPA: hypothetical protein VK215_09270 [Acidimicrobiales bacterium]|nr:hypothetical protein [Acidimicrobiales bacterium]
MDDRLPASSRGGREPSAWPEELDEVFGRSVTVEYASLTRAGSPVTIPTTPYVNANGLTIDVSTGLTYPAKAERARRDPRVCLLFADPVGSGMADPPVVLVQGLATVRDSDLQTNTDRYVRLSMEKLPDATKGQPRFALRRLAWYYARIWIEVTPLHVRWWPSRSLEEPVRTWNAPEGTAAPLSDPAPSGTQPHAWLAPPASWHAAAQDAGRLATHDLTVVDANGFPLCVPVMGTEVVDDGFVLTLGGAAPAVIAGPACLTMHSHPERFTGQENRTIIGTVEPPARPGDAVRFCAERALADWSLAGGRPRLALSFLATGRRLAPRLATEAQRRFQPVPRVRLPDRR